MLPSSHWLAVSSILDAYWTRGLYQTHTIGSREPPAPIGRNRHRKVNALILLANNEITKAREISTSAPTEYKQFIAILQVSKVTKYI